MSGISSLKSKLQSFKKRFYLRQLLIGSLIFLILSSSLYLLINGLEYKLWLGSTARSIVFFSSLLTVVFLFIWLITRPLAQILKVRKGISDEDAAREISKSFPEIQDKLLNTLQLSRLSQAENDLIQAAIEKKSRDLTPISFTRAVDFSRGKRYGLYLGVIVLFFTLVSFVNPSIFTDSTTRIINFRQEFTPEAPFQFTLPNQLLAFRGEDFTLEVEIQGSSIPEELIIHTKAGLDLRMRQTGASTFQYNFPKVQESVSFQLEGSGFFSNVYQLEVNDRPDLIAMNITIQSPRYTGGERKQISNSGNISVLEGSNIVWELSTLSTDEIKFFLSSNELETSKTGERQFVAEERVFESIPYQIELFNQYGKNNSAINYEIAVIKDQLPTISAEYFPDTSLYQFITVAGNIIDDHGFSRLSLNYKRDGADLKSIPLELAAGSKKQSFYANWNVDSLQLGPGEKVEFYISVSDNDAVNGSKTSRTRTYVMQIPGSEELEEIIDKKSEVVENQIDKSQKEAESINDRLEELEEKLKSEQKFDWQERKQLNDIIEDREDLEKQIKDLQEQHKDLQRSADQFNKRSESLRDQNEQLQQLLDEMMDEETRQLYEQLKELLKDENTGADQVRQQLQDIQRNEKNLEKELERALELFKRLKMESALEQNLQQLDSLSKIQEELSKKDESQIGEKSLEDQQKNIKEEFQKFRDKMDEVEQLNQELKRPEPLQDFELEERQIARELREIEELMDDLKEQQEGESEGQQEQGNQDSENQEEGQNSQSSQSEDQNQKESGENAQSNEGQQQESQESQSSSEENQNQQQESQNQPSGQQQQSSKQIQQKQKNASQRMKQLSQQLSNMQSGMQMEMMQANLDQLRDILDNLVKLSFNQEELLTEMREVNQSDPRFLELSQAQLKLKDDAKVIQDSLLSLAERVVQLSSFITREVGSINENIDEALDYLKDRNRGRALSSQQFAMTSINNLALLLDDTMQQMQMAMSEAMGNPSQSQQQQKGMSDLQEMQQQLGQQMNELRESGKQGRELSEELARLAAEQEMIRRQLEMIKEAEDGRPGNTAGDDLQRAIDQMEQNEIDLVNKRLTRQLINRQKSIETRLLEAEKAQREQELEQEREAETPSVFSREIPPQFEEYLKMKQKEIELLKTIPVELNPFYKKEVNDYFRRISSDTTND